MEENYEWQMKASNAWNSRAPVYAALAVGKRKLVLKLV